VDEIENENTIISNAAYNLFYARRDIDFEHIDYERIKNKLKIENIPSSMMITQ
jgi:hypothetical protein